MIKMVIAMRTDLDMNRGKMCAQAGHASLMYLVEKLNDRHSDLTFTSSEEEWYLGGGMTKIVVAINSPDKLRDLENQCEAAGLKCFSVTDRTLGVKTCCAIGPDDSDKIDKITRQLPLLR